MITQEQLLEMKQMYSKAADGLADAEQSAKKLEAIGITMDLSKLRGEVEKLKTMVDTAQAEVSASERSAAEFEATNRPKPSFTGPVGPAYDDDEQMDLEKRVGLLEIIVTSLRGQVKALERMK